MVTKTLFNLVHHQNRPNPTPKMFRISHGYYQPWIVGLSMDNYYYSWYPTNHLMEQILSLFSNTLSSKNFKTSDKSKHMIEVRCMTS